MTNRYESLRTDTRNMLGHWIEYPLAQEVETITLFRDRCQHVDIKIGRQDGYFVVGINSLTVSGGIAFGCSRKWGQFKTGKDAIVWALGELLCHDLMIRGEVRKAVSGRLLAELQATLF